MKKIVAIFAFILAFSANASAQDQKLSAPEAAKKDAAAITEYLGLTPEQQVAFTGLFEHKYRVLNDATIPEPRKEEMRRSVGFKITASITPEQQDKLSKNPELLAQLVN